MNTHFAHLDDDAVLELLNLPRDTICKGVGCYNLRAADDVQSSFYLTPNALERGLGYSLCQECIADMSVDAQLAQSVEIYYADKVQCDVIGCSRLIDEQSSVVSVCEECVVTLTDEQTQELLELEHTRTDYHLQTQAIEELEATDYMEAHHYDNDYDD